MTVGVNISKHVTLEYGAVVVAIIKQSKLKMASRKSEHDDDEDDNIIVILEDKSALLEDESEDPILQLRGRLYNYQDERKQWKERGDGVVKFLKHKESGRVRLLMRPHSNSSHLIANHPIMPAMKLEEYAGKENSCMWHATDYEGGELKDELFRIQFDSAEDWEAFIQRFEDVVETQSKKEENEDTNAAAGFLEKSTFGEAKSKEQEARGAISNMPMELKEPVSEEERAQAEAKA